MRLVVAFIACIAIFMPLAYAQGAYLLNPGDQIFIEVWNEPDMQRNVIILPDGNVSFPLAGQIKAAGLSLQELQDSIAEKLGQYINSPVVTVSIAEMAGNTIYVIGQVNAPGAFVMNRPMTALQALSLSGGFTAFADIKRIKIIRKSQGVDQVLRVNYSELSNGDGLESNYALQSGDVLVVP